MPRNIQLLKQVNRAIKTVASQSNNPEHLALLDGAAVAINELMLKEDTGFYADYFNKGLNFLNEARAFSPGKHQGEILSSMPSRLSADAHPDIIEQLINKLHKALTEVVSDLDETDPRVKDYLNRLVSWEEKLYFRRLEQIPLPSAGDNNSFSITRESLQHYLQLKFPGWTNLIIVKFQSLDGGFSKKTILFETKDNQNGSQSMVVRAEQPVNLLFYRGSQVSKEFPMIQLMQREGIPVAEPLWLESDPEKLGVQFIISRQVEGKTYGGNIGSNEPLPENLVNHFMEVLAQIHSIKPNPTDALVQASHLKEWLPYASLYENTKYYVGEYMRSQAALSEIEPPPFLERAWRWLEQNIPETDEQPVIIHLDYALNNLLIKDERITAVLDWESSRLGDPAEELIHTQKAMANCFTMPELLTMYQERTGRKISEYRLKYFKIANFAISAIVLLRAAKMVDIYDDVNINLCKLALPYSGVFLTGLNTMIEEAEACRSKSN